MKLRTDDKDLHSIIKYKECSDTENEGNMYTLTHGAEIETREAIGNKYSRYDIVLWHL